MTLQEMINNYKTLTEEQQAHVDAALDSQSDEGLCVCGEPMGCLLYTSPSPRD